MFKVLDDTINREQFKIKSDNHFIKIYLLNGYVLQAEFDRREYDLFLYLINTVDNTLPVDGVIYHYDDGRWCRKYIEELYKIKNPVYDSPKSVRYTEEFIDLKIDFYKSIFKNPEPLWEKIREMNTGNTGDGSVC